MQDRDHEFLLRVGLLPALYRMASFERHTEYFPRVRELPASEWFIWPSEFVITGLRAGTLSVKDVVVHVTTAPAGVLSAAWLAARGLGSSVEEAALRHSVASVITVHADMLRELMADGSPVLNEAAQAKDLSRRVMNCRLLAPDAAATTTIAGGSPVHQGSVVNRLVEVDGLAVEFRQCAQGLLHLLCALSLGLHHTSDTRSAPTKDASDKADAPDADAGEDDEMLERRQSARYVLSTRVSRLMRRSCCFLLCVLAVIACIRCCCFQKQVRGLLEAELAFAAEVLVHDATKRVTGGAGDAVAGFIDAFGQSTPAVLKAVEEAAYNTLVFLSAIHACTGRSTSDWDSNMLTSLVDLTLVGSPRIQQLALRVMRDALPHVQPNRVNAIVLAAVQRTLPLFLWPGGVSIKGEDAPHAPSSFAELLLHKISCTLCVTPAASTESGGSLCQPIGTGAGYAAQCTAAEASSLARHLLLAPGSAWCSAMADAVNRALLSASPFIAGPALTDDSAKSERCRRAMAAAAAALCLMGADADVLRTGGRFAMANSVQAARAAATASAAVDSSRERPSEAGADGAASPEASEAARSIANKALMGVLQLQAPEGVVLAYRFGALRADVVFFSDVDGRSITSTQSLLVSTIIPAAEVVVRPAAIPLTPDLLRMLLAVCQLDLGVSADASRRKNPVAAVSGAAGGPAPVEVWSVWRSQLKSRAMQALQVLLQDAGCSAAALSAGLFPHLLRAALVPVPMPQFVALRWLQFRANVLRERLLDAASGVIIGQEVAAGGAGPVLSAEEVKRHAQADELVSMGLGKKDLCVTALLLNRDVMDRAVEWLLGREAEAFVEGGGLDKSLGEANPRWGAARDLGLVVAMHPKLCYHALELSGDDRNAATTWLMEHGLGYAKSEWIVGSEREAISTATVSRAHV